MDKDLEYSPTLETTFVTYNFEFEHENFNLDIWDTSGKDRYYRLNKMMIKDSDIIFFFYNSYDISSFETVKSMVEICKEDAKKNSLFVLIRSRYDECLETNENKKIILDEEALECADLNNLFFVHLSNYEKNDTSKDFLKIFLKNFVV